VRATRRGTRLKQAARASRVKVPPRRLEDPLPTPARPRVRSPSPAPNLSLGSSSHMPLRSNGSPAHVSALSRPGTRPGIRPVIQGPRRRSRARCLAFPLPFGRRRLLFGASFPAREFRPPYGRPTTPPTGGADPDEVSMFRTRETRLAQVPSLPRGRRCPQRPVFSRPPACRIATASPCHPGPRPAPGCIRDEASARVHCHSPHTSLPLTCDPGRNGVLGLFPELRTPPGKTRQRTSGRGQAQTLPGLRPWHQPASFDVLTHNVRPHVARSAGSGALISEGGPGPPSVTALRLRYRQPRLGLCGKRQERPALVSVAEVRPRRRAAAFPERGARCWQQRDAGRHVQPDNPAGGGATT